MNRMKLRSLLAMGLALTAAVSACANDKNNDKKKKQTDRGTLEKMIAVPCGAKQKGLTGLGSVWASAGITHINSDEKLCPQYLLRTDEMEYEIRPTEKKHPEVLPVGEEISFKIKKDKMFVKRLDGDKKTRSYEVVAMKPPEGEVQSPSAEARPR